MPIRQGPTEYIEQAPPPRQPPQPMTAPIIEEGARAGGPSALARAARNESA